jgi:soluble lytic murein transglycosylase-like protein
MKKHIMLKSRMNGVIRKGAWMAGLAGTAYLLTMPELYYRVDPGQNKQNGQVQAAFEPKKQDYSLPVEKAAEVADYPLEHVASMYQDRVAAVSPQRQEHMFVKPLPKAVASPLEEIVISQDKVSARPKVPISSKAYKTGRGFLNGVYETFDAVGSKVSQYSASLAQWIKDKLTSGNDDLEWLAEDKSISRDQFAEGISPYIMENSAQNNKRISISSSREMAEQIYSAAEEFRVSPAVLAAIISQESSFNERAVGDMNYWPNYSEGMGQMQKGTSRLVFGLLRQEGAPGLPDKMPDSFLKYPELHLRMYARYLRLCMDRADGDGLDGIRRYSAGHESRNPLTKKSYADAVQRRHSIIMGYLGDQYANNKNVIGGWSSAK